MLLKQSGPQALFADVCVGLLNQGQSVRFKANGWSMHPTICDGEMINVEPVLPSQVRHGDIILYRSPRGITAHRVVHIQKEMNSALSPQPSVKLSGHWVIRLLGHFWVSLSPNSQRRTPNVSNHRSIASCPCAIPSAYLSIALLPSTLDTRHSYFIPVGTPLRQTTSLSCRTKSWEKCFLSNVMDGQLHFMATELSLSRKRVFFFLP